ncbi:MAG: protein kinase [Candidatus Krumholzibacteriia bacterium]
MIGETIGPYEVQSLLGRGGMGEVYRARDTRLDRDVALKILPTGVAGDPDRLGRFEREARLLAALQHQNIASIYGLEDLDGQPVLVMELAEGDDLSVRLAAGPLDVDEVDRYARQLARGLEFAHERGIIHRDLKPANLKLGPDGRLKILDFGLARAYGGPTGSAAAAAMSAATVPQDLTRPGTVLGTAAYMSPEQARGYEVDRRTDIWAFGVILFEMLTGRKLFAGETASDTMAAILRQEPDFTALPPDTPPLLVQLIRRCLEKDPQKRLRDIGEVRVALEDGSSSYLDASMVRSSVGLNPTLTSPRRPRLPWLLVGLLAAAVVLVGWLGLSGRLGPPPAPPPLVQAQIVLPDRTSFSLNPASPGPPALSPDGRHVTFAALDSTGRVTLYLRSLADGVARSIVGTADAAYPFWSPDSREIAFFHDGSLCRVDIAGGPVVTICPASNGKGGSWNSDDVILFAPSHIASINRVLASGGEPVAVTSVEADSLVRSHRFPCWLPDNRHFVYLAWRNQGARDPGNETELRLAAVDGSVDRPLLATQTNAQFAGGQLLYVHEGNLMGRPFSVADLDFTGPPQPLLGGVLAMLAAHVAVVSATDAGVLVYVGGGGVFGQARYYWIDPDGTAEPAMPMVFLSPQGMSLSPDGRRIAVAQADERTGTFDVWVYERDREVGARFTFESESETNPIWTHDGQWVTYSTNVAGRNRLYNKRASGAGRPELLVEMDSEVYPDCWSSDGRQLILTVVGKQSDLDLWRLDLDSDAGPQPLRVTPFNEGGAAFSRDDRWLAYVSQEAGMADVFVESMAGDGGRYRISAAGGSNPVWSADGSALYYLDPTGRLLKTQLTLGDRSLDIGETSEIATGVDTDLVRTFDLDRTTGQLIVQRAVQNRVSDQLQLVTGWQNLLRRDDRGP